MRIYTSAVVFPCTFAQAALALWHKYPNPHAAHVHAVDVLERRVCPASGCIYTDRLLTLRQSAPWWIRRLLGAQEYTYVYERGVVDLSRASIRATSANLSFSELLPVCERIEYRPAGAQHTLFVQRAEIECRTPHVGLLDSVAHTVEEAAARRFAENAARGRDGFAHVLARLFGGSRAWRLLDTNIPT